jgi:hypothetical protein
MNTTGSYTCGNCPAGYTNSGPHNCAEINECSPNPCQNGGDCTDVVNGFSCDCAGTGYSGTTCQTDINECTANTDMCSTSPMRACMNNAGGYTCGDCPAGYTNSGPHNCADINECMPNPCQNGGMCTNLVNAFSCNCAGTGYSGTTCQTEINECMPNPCQHGGMCTNLVNDFSCDCAGTGYSGTTCQTNIDECMAGTDSCDNMPDACQDTDGGFMCVCPGGYTGDGVGEDGCTEDPPPG